MMTMRYIARLTLEAATPLAVGSGETDLKTDAPVALDINGLPYIPGTSLCGVLRHAVMESDKTIVDTIFGYQKPGSDEGQGSRLIVSDAVCLNENGQPCEGLIKHESSYLHWLRERPVRDHVRINRRGTGDSEGHGKFDNEVVPRGVRFAMELSLIGTADEQATWDRLLATLNAPSFRVGSGTRKGYGRLKIVADRSQTLVLDLTKQNDLERYLAYSSSLRDAPKGDPLSLNPTDMSAWIPYELKLQPEGFWLFGSGYGDKDADMTPLCESSVSWDKESGAVSVFNKLNLVVPGSSVKGAISHRAAFHFNRRKNIFADKLSIEDFERHTGEKNDAVKALFGNAKNSKEKKEETHAGRVLIDDVFLPYNPTDSKILNHVSIDRFTGGALDGALFDERVIGKKPIILKLLVHKDALKEPDIRGAFEDALTDIIQGRLPLGGGVMRGHGTFQGELNKPQQEAHHA